MVIVSYATRGIIGGTDWDDFYEWYRKTGQKKMPWATAVPGLHAFFDYKDRRKWPVTTIVTLVIVLLLMLVNHQDTWVIVQLVNLLLDLVSELLDVLPIVPVV